MAIPEKGSPLIKYPNPPPTRARIITNITSKNAVLRLLRAIC